MEAPSPERRLGATDAIRSALRTSWARAPARSRHTRPTSSRVTCGILTGRAMLPATSSHRNRSRLPRLRGAPAANIATEVWTASPAPDARKLCAHPLPAAPSSACTGETPMAHRHAQYTLHAPPLPGTFAEQASDRGQRISRIVYWGASWPDRIFMLMSLSGARTACSSPLNDPPIHRSARRKRLCRRRKRRSTAPVERCQ